MDQPQTILVGTDFSDISDEALRAASLYAKMFNSRVLVTHVFDPTPNVPPVVWSRPDLLERSIRVEIEEAIRETLTGKTAELLQGVPEVELSVIQHPSPGEPWSRWPKTRAPTSSSSAPMAEAGCPERSSAASRNESYVTRRAPCWWCAAGVTTRPKDGE